MNGKKRQRICGLDPEIYLPLFPFYIEKRISIAIYYVFCYSKIYMHMSNKRIPMVTDMVMTYKESW